MDALINELKMRIIEALKLADLKPEDIDADAPLFGEASIASVPKVGKTQTGVVFQRFADIDLVRSIFMPGNGRPPVFPVQNHMNMAVTQHGSYPRNMFFSQQGYVTPLTSF